MSKQEVTNVYEDMEITKLNNGIKIIYKPNYENNMSIGFLEFGHNVEFSYKKIGIVHFIEHIISYILQKILKQNVSAFTSFQEMYINFEKFDIINPNILDKIIDLLFLNNKIHIDGKYLTKYDIKYIRHHINNEMEYRTINNYSRGFLFIYLLSGYDYAGGTGFDIKYDIVLFNKLLSLISTKNMVFISSDKNVYNYLISKLRSIKKSPKSKIIIRYNLPKQQIKNAQSTLLVSITELYYTATIFIPMDKSSLIGAFIMCNFLFNDFMMNTFNDKIAISIYKHTMNNLIAVLTFLKKKENLYELVIDKNDVYIFYQCILYNDYIDTFNIFDILSKTNSCEYFKNDIQHTLDLIVNSYNKYDSFFLNIPFFNKYNLYNDKTILDYNIFKTEVVLNIPNFALDKFTSTIYKIPLQLLMKDFTNDTNVCFFLFSDCSYQLTKDGIIMQNFKNVYIDNKYYILHHSFYFDKIPISIYLKYILLFLLTNIFSSLYDIITYYHYIKILYYNSNYVTINSFRSNIHLDSKIINIKTEYNFIVCLINIEISNFKNINFLINEISHTLISKFLIYLVKYHIINNFLVAEAITNNPNKSSKICQKIFAKHKIQNYIIVVSNKSKTINVDELIKSKVIMYK
ncbi:ORF MSV056 putative vaccinia G1L metaloprotease homolog, similar to GB:X76267 [Melanoplus sanguinipes entomopoxvirus]|uniref:Metalloendopeptidase n=1 Tax=Melanoplus sanguinipes entomopoxvirus TaxID=83191 RepID=Q9YW36_MSEPV|nr:ORF MSV056 putative vaccinia G1L metaloprotease homolog, similar to GB:X76267 [Melanoplus sanguinipes entomopoxvirus]AAC97620.1 ORF MSV056 putative vaccinia G1L metaloprotease homolog, similar to GB:X76267 [Melanoplus sanguinipes entomopoxvirus 'O']